MKSKNLTYLAVYTLAFCNIPYASSSTFIGHVTYTLSKVSNPTADQSDAYTRITSVMDSAVWFYNTYTTVSKKLTIEYKPDVQTADGNSNGNIRFGKDRSYMVGCTAMHEIAHTTGIGTSSEWSKLIVNGKYTGQNGIKKLHEIDSTAILKGDSQHFWPYGLNYASEVKSKDDLIDHCLIVNAIQKDLHPSSIILAGGVEKPQYGLSIFLNLENAITYSIPFSVKTTIGIYNISGQKIAVIEQGIMTAGIHLLPLDNIKLPRGNYIFRISAGRNQQNRLLPVIKNCAY